MPIHEPMYPNESTHPFIDPVSQKNHQAPLQTWFPKRIGVSLYAADHPNKPMRRSIVMPLRNIVPNLGVFIMPTCSNLLVASYLGKPLSMFGWPRHPLSQHGCQRNAKFHILEELDEGLHTLLFKGLTSFPTLGHFYPPKNQQNMQSPSFHLNLCLHCS